MRRFKFTLESVLTVRKKALEDARIRLASITNIYNQQQLVLKEMQQALENIRNDSEKYLLQETFNPCMVSNYSAFSNKITQDITSQKLIIERTKLDLAKQQEISEIYKKVKVLEKLKEKQEEEYYKNIETKLAKEIDDMVTTRYKVS